MKRASIFRDVLANRTADPAEKKYWVMADCCTSGNCIQCGHLPVGKKVRRSIMGAKPITLELAKKVQQGWKSYGPTIETENTEGAER